MRMGCGLRPVCALIFACRELYLHLGGLDNYPEPGKRPLSSTAPTIIEHPDGSFYLAIGGSGGSRIFGSIFQVLLNLDWGLDVSAAIESGRLHDQLYPSILDADNIYEKDILRDLRRRGHNVTSCAHFLCMVASWIDSSFLLSQFSISTVWQP
jgi:gamma-glutamyltranspeptidase